jgi:hypothetical protein
MPKISKTPLFSKGIFFVKENEGYFRIFWNT